MKTVLYLSTKYLKLRKSERGISVMAKIALYTVIASTTASVLILSAVNGMHEDLMSRIIAKDAHITILGPGKGIKNYETYLTNLRAAPGVTSATAYYDGQVLAKNGDRVWAIGVKAFPAEVYSNDTELTGEFPIEEGAYDFARRHRIVLGSTLATNLGVGVGDKIKLIVYSSDIFGEQYSFLVAGVYNSGYSDYDGNLAFMELADAQEIFDAEGYAYGLAVKVENPDKVEDYYEGVAEACPYYQYTWKRLNRNKLFSLENEKMLMRIILFFFFFVVFFNILSTMIAMVLEKNESIAILKAIGLKPEKSLLTFVFDGFVLGVAGSTLGTLLGLFLSTTINTMVRIVEKIVDAVNLSAYWITRGLTGAERPEAFHIFTGDMSEIPIKIQFGDIVFVIVLAVVVSVLAVWVPARRASRRRPVEILRND